jgi:hypothetical protein
MTFFIGSYRGYVAIWEDNCAEPIKVFPYCTRIFPEEDRKLLENRIPAGMKIEAGNVIENRQYPL